MDFADVFRQALNRSTEKFVEMLANVISFLPELAAGLIIFTLGWLAARLIRRWGRRVSKRIDAPEPVEKLIVASLYIVALIGAASLALAAMNVKIYPLITGLGISGLIVGFALKDIIENLMAGALILLQNPFSIGDHIEVDGIEGHVTNIQMRSTTIKTLDHIEVVIPNRTVYTNNVTNYNTYPLRRWRINLGIGYGQELEVAKADLLEVVRSVDGVAPAPEPAILFDDFGESAVKAILFYHINGQTQNVFAVRSAVLTALHSAAEEMSLDLPYPTSIVINK